MHDTTDFTLARQRMVTVQIMRRGVHDPAVLAAMRRVPRELFVDEHLKAHAYGDLPLPIGYAQTISQPFTVAMMVAAAAIRPADQALEIGAGSGYATAVLSRLAGTVRAIERRPELAAAARRRLKQLGCDNVVLRTGDGTRGWPGSRLFDVIIVSAGGPVVPEALGRQLAIGGRLVMPVGPVDGEQRLMKFTRRNTLAYVSEDLGPVRFVPLIGGALRDEASGAGATRGAPGDAGQPVRPADGAALATADLPR